MQASKSISLSISGIGNYRVGLSAAYGIGSLEQDTTICDSYLAAISVLEQIGTTVVYTP
jgi:hypothetical protein